MTKVRKALHQKTTWTGIGALITALGGFYTGEMSIADAAQTVFIGLSAIFLRQAVSKGN